MAYEKSDLDFITGTFQDIDGRLHIADPVTYLFVENGLANQRAFTTEAVKELAKTPSERVEIAEKYSKVKRDKGEMVVYGSNPVSGGKKKMKEIGFPTFSFRGTKRSK